MRQDKKVTKKKSKEMLEQSIEKETKSMN